jgi:hypothetical protein
VTGGSGGALREWAIPGEYLDDDEEKVRTTTSTALGQARTCVCRAFAHSLLN